MEFVEKFSKVFHKGCVNEDGAYYETIVRVVDGVRDDGTTTYVDLRSGFNVDNKTSFTKCGVFLKANEFKEIMNQITRRKIGEIGDHNRKVYYKKGYYFTKIGYIVKGKDKYINMSTNEFEKLLTIYSEILKYI